MFSNKSMGERLKNADERIKIIWILKLCIILKKVKLTPHKMRSQFNNVIQLRVFLVFQEYVFSFCAMHFAIFLNYLQLRVQ